ncbi:MAG: ribosomal protein S2, flavodoxin-like domain-containing protein [Piptocephalis tieghemiana]|nr:MAG: ribosomal protein S2, flavodoxin-like domain-containing protein [Piptocephalis tieghemiana]
MDRRPLTIREFQSAVPSRDQEDERLIEELLNVSGEFHDAKSVIGELKDVRGAEEEMELAETEEKLMSNEEYQAEQERQEALARDTQKRAISIVDNMPVLTPLDQASKKPTVAPDELNIQTLMEAGLHIGHSRTAWDHRTLPYIFGTRSGISIINLELTLGHLRRACGLVKDIAYSGGIILFIGTRPEMDGVARSAAAVCGGYYVSTRWLPGTISNADEVLSPRHQYTYVSSRAKLQGELDISKLADIDVGGPEVEGENDDKAFKPDVVVLLNPLDNIPALTEANRAFIPTIGIVDSNCNPSLVSYPIPGNDDARRGVELVAGVLARAAREGVQQRQAYERKFKQQQEEKGVREFDREFMFA